ncbi:MAG: type II toxin-antitoxin system Phd/YefM family antitoxin [Verrucomicrobia bacterium]|nr:type II toxin-antitoxin system Phd/YefM family antitoxin [Verrucomicrobiota bacterium]
MTVVPFSDARSCLTDIVNEVAYAGKRVILTRKGKKLAAIVSLEDLEALEKMKGEGRLKEVLQDALKKRTVRRKRTKKVRSPKTVEKLTSGFSA